MILPVNIAPVADIDDEDDESLVQELAKHAMIADPVAPELVQRASQALADLTWIVKRSNAIVQKIENTGRGLSVCFS